MNHWCPPLPLSTPVVLWYTICGFDVTWNTMITRCVCETLMPPASVHTCRVMVHDVWLWCHLKYKDNKMCLWNTDAPQPPLPTPVVLWYTIYGCDVTWNTTITRCVCETLMPPTASVHTCRVMVHDVWLWCYLKHRDDKMCLWNTQSSRQQQSKCGLDLRPLTTRIKAIIYTLMFISVSSLKYVGLNILHLLVTQSCCTKPAN